MADRIVKIKVDADATGAVKGFAAVRDSVAETRAKMVESAKSSREEWATVGKGLTAVGVAVTGVGLAAAKTGVEYNTLQQTTRAALTTILGGARAANAQMDKLDEFARSSPFAKQTFITAQQQMLAFGVETKKVIPYLDALQNAVAASGGSNQDIAELAEIFGKIQSSAKITSVDMQMFGRRGVNAAEIIGKQMGKTAGQIRGDITDSALDAGEALDALAKGMSEQYAGAAANVKQTFSGAMDRVKAAWRDFSSELAKPLVDPNGGGMLIDLLNWTADAMRNFQKLPAPIQNTTRALAGLTGGGALLIGTAMLVIPQIIKMQAALTALGFTKSMVAGGFKDFWKFLTGPWGVALVGAAAAVQVLNRTMEASKSSSQQLTTAMKQGVSAFTEMERTSKKNSNWIFDAKVAYENLGEALQSAEESGTGFNRWLNLTLGQTAALDSVKELGLALTELSDTNLPEAQRRFAQFGQEAGLNRYQLRLALSNEMPEFKTRMIELAEATGLATDDNTLLELALGQLNQRLPSTAAEATNVEGSVEKMADAAKEAWKAVDSLMSALNEFNGVGQSAESTNSRMQDSFAKVQEHIDNVKKGVEGYTGSLDASTAAGSSNRAMLSNMAADIQKNAEAQFELEKSTIGAKEAVANYEQRLADGRQKVLDMATAMSGNADEAQKLTDKIALMPAKKDIEILLKGATAAENILNNLARPRGANIIIQTPNSNVPDMYANGGTIGFANGGTIPGFAGGGTTPRRDLAGIGGGVTGGTVWGAGTAKSDSVLVRLSKGEEVVQEPFASMYRNELKAMNRGSFQPSTPPPMIIQAPSGGRGGDVSVTVNPSRGMSEREVGAIVAEKLSWEMEIGG